MPRYSRQLRDHAADPQNAGPLEGADATGVASLPGGYPRVQIHLKFEGDRVAAAAFQAWGCGVTVACGSALTELVAGKSRADCRRLSADDLAAALDGLPPDKRHCAEVMVAALQAALRQTSQDDGTDA